MRSHMNLRIQILEGADMIDASVAAFCRKAVEVILEAKPDADEERFGMLITHLAMGAQRLLNQQEEHPVDAGILESVKQEPGFAKAEQLAETLISMGGIPFSQTESDFLKIHLCNLLS